MTEDARFEDAGEGPLRLKALEAEDLHVISALVQDSVFPITEMAWDRRRRRFAALLNRFRWEDPSSLRTATRSPERVQSILLISDVVGVVTQGLDRSETETVLSLLALSWEPGEDGTGKLILTLAGDGAIALDVECLDVTLKDVTQPYVAPSSKTPSHPE